MVLEGQGWPLVESAIATHNMVIEIDDVLSLEALQQIQETLRNAEFVDGKTTAGWHAKLVKDNRQLQRQSPEAQDLKEWVIKALKRHALFRAAVQPRHIHSVLFSRYETGMSYGSHVDNALMGGQTFWRSDVSFTLFLAAPSDYEGGELVMEYGDGERSYKLGAGCAIAYPSSTLHRVEPVTAGVRLVAVGWVQSLVRDPAERELLFELDTVRRSLFAQTGKTTEFDLLCKCHANLLRKWANP